MGELKEYFMREYLLFLHGGQVWGFGGVCARCLPQSVHTRGGSAGLGVSQPSDTSAAKATCGFESLQFSVARRGRGGGQGEGLWCVRQADAEDARERSGGRPPLRNVLMFSVTGR